MPRLYGRDLTRRETRALAGEFSQFAGVRLMTLGDGVEAGVRMLEFRTGTGLRFTVLVDRAFDVADVEHRGRAVGWHSPAGFRNPALHDYEAEGGLGWLRAFSGFNVTCGLDHILFMHEQDAAHYHYGPRKTVASSIHGRISTIPARLVGYGEAWDGDRCTLWAEAVVRQSTVFGEDLHLHRRVATEVGSDAFTLEDRVVNDGFYRTPHMFLYHINAGFPVLDEGARYLAPIADVLWAGHAGEAYRAQEVGYRTLGAPANPFHEQVWEHAMAADAGHKVPVALVNDRLGFGVLVETDIREFPCHYEWQNLQAGMYALGLEPSTNHVLGKAFALERDELIWLEHGDERRYSARVEILDGAPAIAAAEARIRAIAVQPDAEYPEPSGAFPDLRRA
jgi:hypothetical protein